MNKKILFMIFIVCSFLNVFPYTPKATAYFKSFINEQTDIAKANALIQFCGEYRTYPYDTLRKYSYRAVDISKKINDLNSLAQAYYYLTTYYYRTSNLDSANIFRKNGESLAIKTKNKSLQWGFILLGNSILTKEGKNEEALSSYYGMLKIPDIKKDTFSYLCVLHGIGWANMEILRYTEAKKWFIKAIDYPEEKIMEENKIVSYLNLSVCYGAINDLDSARFYINKSIQLAKKYDNIITEANGYNILSNIHSAQGKFDEAIKSTKQSMKIREKIGDPYYIVSDLAQLSLLYSQTNQFKLGIQAAEEALQLAREKKIKSKYIMIYESLYHNFYGIKDYKSSTELLIKLLALKDSLQKVATNDKLAELETKYNIAQKEMTIKKQESEIQEKNLVILFVFLSLVGIMITGFFLYRLLVYKQRSKIKTIELEQQQKLTQSIFETEENEKKRIGASLHDGLGQLLSVIKMNLQFMQTHVKPINDKVPDIYYKTLDLVEDSIKETRNVSHQLLPNFITSKGLRNAVEELGGKLKNPKLQIEVNAMDMPESLNNNIKVNVYRIIQECLNNIIKHAEASRVFVTLNTDEEFLHGLIEDNGKGFDKSNALKNGIGLNNIKTRVDFMKGKLDINSTSGKGTITAFHIPLE